jgi:DNA mismatch repair ATPase MutS
VEEPARDLDLLSQILATLEEQQFRSPLLASLRKAIDVNGRAASHRIGRIRRLIDMLDSRDNPFVRALGPLLLWGTQVGMAVESWRAENGAHIAGWLDAVSEMEALSSLANYAWEHPEDPFPEFADGPTPVFDGELMGHPLLPEERCVSNSVRIVAPLRLLVVSGSNMSGKSTLLRTIGVNTVLALAGAPVRAKRLELSHLSLGASIRTTDSLEEGHSRFMAEILRLKQVLELPAPALFLLDELLGGTNSHDRALGSEGLIRALLARGAVGLVTTHDLSLARIADELAPAAANVHFEDRLEDGRLVFDYRMRPGVVERSNALDLMRAVGLDV